MAVTPTPAGRHTDGNKCLMLPGHNLMPPYLCSTRTPLTSLSHPFSHLRCQEDHPDGWEVEFPKLHVTLKASQFSWHRLHPLTTVRWPVFSLPLQHRILEGRDSISYSFQLPSVISRWQMYEQNVQPILLQVTQGAEENI